MLTAHDAVIMLVVYVCTGLSEDDLLEFARGNTVTNASVTTLRREAGASWWTLDRFADVDHLAEEDAPVTVHARGQWSGRTVDYTERFSSACFMTARTGSVFALDD